MVRILFYVVVVFALALGFAWLADRPGVLQLTWLGYQYEISLVVAVVAFLAIVALLLILIWLVRAIVTTPRAVGDYFTARRRDRGYRALSRGMIAVGAGDQRVATRAADEAAGLLGEEPMTLLLTAQAAQLASNGDLARSAFEKLAASRETRVLGLHGLFIEARRQGEDEAARHFAEEATRTAPKIAWAGEALFDYQAQAGDWLGALRTLSANAEAKLIDKPTAQRLRAVLLTAWALDSEASEPDEARARAQEAHRLAPGFSEAAVVAGRLLARANDFRRASRVLETTWKAAPHPDVADTYATVRSGDSVRDRLKRVRRLAELRPNHPEGAMALARAAIDAHEWQTARTALERLLRSQPSERVCVLMAEIEEGEHGDEGRVRAWLARAINAPRDPAWIADGRIFQHWAPISPVSGRIDAFEWKVADEPSSEPRMPQIDVGPEMTVAETEAPKKIEATALAAAEPSEAAEVFVGGEPGRSDGGGPGEPAEAASSEAEVVASSAEAQSTATAPPEAEPEPPNDKAEAEEGAEVSPIPRAPDDPGPEASDNAEKPRRNLFGYST